MVPDLQQPKDAVERSLWRKAAAERLIPLTPREREVLNLIVVGRSNKLIAHDLGISQRTVERHRLEVMKRTGTRTLPELIRLVSAADDPAFR